MKRGNSFPYYPIFLNISGRRCVVVGGGQVALRKVKTLLEHGARVVVISLDLCPELGQLGEEGTVRILCRGYVPEDLEDSLIAVAATDDSKINGKVAAEAKRRGVLVNVADDPQRSDFIVPSYLRRGDVTIAVSTAGRSPALARKIRTRLEKDIGIEYASLAVLVNEVRSELKQQGIRVNGDAWQEALDLDSLIQMVQTGRSEEAKTILLSNLKKLGQRR